MYLGIPKGGCKVGGAADTEPGRQARPLKSLMKQAIPRVKDYPEKSMNR